MKEIITRLFSYWLVYQVLASKTAQSLDEGNPTQGLNMGQYENSRVIIPFILDHIQALGR